MTVITSHPDPGRPPGVPGSAPRGLEASLRTVTEALEEDARRQSALILARADADSAATLEAARTECERLVQAARAEGTATAQRLAAAQLADARREGRHDRARGAACPLRGGAPGRAGGARRPGGFPGCNQPRGAPWRCSPGAPG